MPTSGWRWRAGGQGATVPQVRRAWTLNAVQDPCATRGDQSESVGGTMGPLLTPAHGEIACRMPVNQVWASEARWLSRLIGLELDGLRAGTIRCAQGDRSRRGNTGVDPVSGLSGVRSDEDLWACGNRDGRVVSGAVRRGRNIGRAGRRLAPAHHAPAHTDRNTFAPRHDGYAEDMHGQGVVGID
jgi:hypothetical protein